LVNIWTPFYPFSTNISGKLQPDPKSCRANRAGEKHWQYGCPPKQVSAILVLRLISVGHEPGYAKILHLTWQSQNQRGVSRRARRGAAKLPFKC
jgi:hypothetical protein